MMPTLKIVVIAFYPKQREEPSEMESRLLNNRHAIKGAAGCLGWKVCTIDMFKKKMCMDLNGKRLGLCHEFQIRRS